MTNQHIPDELGQQVARLAAGLNLDVNEAVRDALESWVERMRQAPGRMPDAAILDGMMLPPMELPHSCDRPIAIQRGARRRPDGVGLG